LTFIENCLYDAEFVKCVIPIFYEPYFDILSNIISVGNDVEIYVPEKLLNSFERKSGIECLKPFDESTSFLLIITDKVMILGFFMDNGYFDQTRILTSNNEDSLIWANNLFKSLNINEF
jgi:predicted transcriptional regulator